MCLQCVVGFILINGCGLDINKYLYYCVYNYISYYLYYYYYY